jgi:hypothetical protein
MADHFDRLVGRGAPAPADGGALRVRPRLPGPFERMGAPAGGAGVLELETEQPASAPTAQMTQAPAARPAPAPPHTYAEPWPARQPVADPLPRALREQVGPEHGTLMAPASRGVVPPPVGPAGRTPNDPDTAQHRATSTEHRITEPTEQHRTPGGRADPAPRSAAAVPAQTTRPAAPARDRGREGNRAAVQQRPPERVVHVSIGRLEVRAAAGRTERPERSARSGRTTPALSLEKYLSREEAKR